MSCCASENDWGPIKAGTQYDCDVILDDDYDLTGLVARVRLRNRTASGTILLTSRSDDDTPFVTIDAPDDRLVISIPGSELLELPTSGVVHIEVDLIAGANEAAGAVFTEAGLLTVQNKSLTEEEEE